MRKIIFDLDLTLVDSSIAEEARIRRNWPLVRSLIPKFKIYDGLQDVFDFIRSNGIEVAIISTAPSSYVWSVTSYFKIPVHTVIGFHDAARKPSPEGMIKAMNLMNASSKEMISFGDRSIDILASKAAGIKSVGCLWGTKEEKRLISSRPDIILQYPSGIIGLLQ